METEKNDTINQLAVAIYTINRHAKTAPDPKHLYHIKKETINKLLKEKKAQKVGLHFSEHPKLSNQYSTLLVRVGDYYFHIPPSKEDFKKLKHLGALDQNYRNPQIRMSLSKAKNIVYNYIDWKPEKKKQTIKRRYTSSYYTPSSLGKMEWPPTHPSRRKY